MYVRTILLIRKFKAMSYAPISLQCLDLSGVNLLLSLNLWLTEQYTFLLFLSIFLIISLLKEFLQYKSIEGALFVMIKGEKASMN